MVQFIVLGYIPGTDIRVNFELIAQLLAVGALVYLIWLYRKEGLYVKQRMIEAINSIVV